jgi:ribonuclease HI
MAKIYTDGAGSMFQGQKAVIAVVFEGSKEILEEIDNPVTNNESEYLAMLKALNLCSVGDELFTDSQLVVGQLTKGWNVNAENLRHFVEEGKNLIALRRCSVTWVPRDKNLAGKLIEDRQSGSWFKTKTLLKNYVDTLPYSPAYVILTLEKFLDAQKTERDKAVKGFDDILHWRLGQIEQELQFAISTEISELHAKKDELKELEKDFHSVLEGKVFSAGFLQSKKSGGEES